MDGKYITYLMGVAGKHSAPGRDPGFTGNLTGFENDGGAHHGVTHVPPYRSPVYGFEDDSGDTSPEGRLDRVVSD